MRCAFLLALTLAAAACGSKSPSTSQRTNESPTDRAATGGPILLVTVRALTETGGGYDLLPLACPGGPDGVQGGRICLDALDRGQIWFSEQELPTPRRDVSKVNSLCQDHLGAARTGFSFQDTTGIKALELWVWPPDAAADLRQVPATPLAPGQPLELDLDGDGVSDRVTITAAGIELVDGRDPLMTERLDPFPDAAELVVRATADLDGDRRRELVIVATHESGVGLAVIEYWSNGEAYRLDCRAP